MTHLPACPNVRCVQCSQRTPFFDVDRLGIPISPMPDVQEFLELHDLHDEVLIRLKREFVHTHFGAGI